MGPPGWADPIEGPILEREGPSAPVGRASVQARIREELLTDPTRSDRAIAAAVGCDHKTVGCDHKTVAKARKTAPASDAAAAAN